MDLMQRVLEAEALSKSAYVFIAKLASELQGREAQASINASRLHVIRHEQDENIDNLIFKSNAENSSIQQKENEEFMQKKLIEKILETKNVRQRNDGRFEWRKTIDGIQHQVIESDPGKFLSNYRDYQKLLKQKGNSFKEHRCLKLKERLTLAELCKVYFKRNIESDRSLKSSSIDRWRACFKYTPELDAKIDSYKKDDIIDYLNDIDSHRTGRYVYFLLKKVFTDEFEKGNTKRNIFATLKNPFPQSLCKKGNALTLTECKTVLDNLNTCDIGKEILFYMLTGCRRSEAFISEPLFEKNMVLVRGTKNEASHVRYVKISPTYCKMLFKDWGNMFKMKPEFYTTHATAFFESLGIVGKSIHSLRHTASTNWHYLGAEDSTRQNYLGHKTLAMTNEIYTHLNPTVTAKDVKDVFKDLYPTFRT